LTAKIEWINEAQWARAVVDHLDEWAVQFGINVKAVADLAEFQAKSRAPVRTGRLRNGIEGRAEETTAILSNGVPYAPHVEYGTRHTRAQPHMRPGMEAAIADWVRIMTKGLK
jgi:HK97 gp10 family phage protein